MLKIITSVILSLVTIMAVTLFAVTVPAQSQKIDENAAAIVKAQTDAETNAYNKVKEDILSDMSGSTLEDVGTAISALQDDVSYLEDKKLYLHNVIVGGPQPYKWRASFQIINSNSTPIINFAQVNAQLSSFSESSKSISASGYIYNYTQNSEIYNIFALFFGNYEVYARITRLDGDNYQQTTTNLFRSDYTIITDYVTQVL